MKNKIVFIRMKKKKTILILIIFYRIYKINFDKYNVTFENQQFNRQLLKFAIAKTIHVFLYIHHKER